MTSLVFTDVDPEDVARVRERFPDAAILESSVQDTDCNSAEVLSCFITSSLQKADLDKLPSLKLVCTRSVGFDHIDLAECEKRGITVCNVPDYGSHVIAEHVFALILSTLRHIPEADKKVESGMFDYHGLRGITLRGKTIGIVGTGKIGRRVAQIAHGFGMKIIAVDTCRNTELEDLLGVQYMELSDMLSVADFVSLHVPATKDTHHMLNAGTLALVKDGIVLVNTARGTLIDTKALINALKTGKVSYALLDVLEHEGNFEEDRALIDMPNVVTTPHIAFYADESMKNMYEDSFQSIEEFLKNEKPEHVVKIPNVVCDMPTISQK